MMEKQGRQSSIVNSLQSLKSTLGDKGSRRKKPLGSTSNFIASRIPTPSKPPQGDMYSHGVYRQEGRRSVLSSLGQRYLNRRKSGKEYRPVDQFRAEREGGRPCEVLAPSPRPASIARQPPVMNALPASVTVPRMPENCRSPAPSRVFKAFARPKETIRGSRMASCFRRSAPAGPVLEVTEPQPRQYWLGRLVTLTNAFHYEDSFHQPDIATGFGMLSSYSRPLGRSDADLSDYRTKRAFMVLENVCTTDQASASLRAFREEYVRFHGDCWMR
ncbi:hypothetical protein P170DRAFT_148225 [Aspergillus steynii IBT 23096]|uniref:Uncharacterized protein n=1 Tax=Aspergillus steynii IBT 23096 TaxID=1392250 RepID=A0A2I2GCG5_9EURO|nr:uncharacterized protein P170DRAFT_148225 [Aspergillus steynii IBT 23096]PLB50560.1 hypothetical protein P170DRAFT_148225 [Aspergillus steynii IBT 23096]